MTRPGRLKLFVLLSLFIVSVTASANFTRCLEDFRNTPNATGGTDFFGRPVDSQNAVGLTYKQCKISCGAGQEAFDWSVFSQQFSAWLLPWLALVSQLPFGAESRLDNLISVALTVGSPTLATFCLTLTALNTRWATHRFSAIKYPNHRNAAKALIYLQQVPLRITTRHGLLASLITLHENDDWWECLVERLEQTFTWTVAAATSIAWVIIAFIFTIVDSFMSLGANLNSNGQAVGTLWLWLVPIVVGWLWVPACSHGKLKNAIEKANDMAFVAAPDSLPCLDDPAVVNPPIRAFDISHHAQAIRICEKSEVFTQDALRAAPVFNYARVWEWYSVVETVAQAFENADRMARRHIPVDPRKDWVFPVGKRLPNHPENRIGTISQVQSYCGFPIHSLEEPMQPVPHGVWKRVLVASIFAFGLQWSTTGSAAIIVIFTPTTGLGCRSGTYVLYGVTSTMIWLTLLLSGFLAHCAKLRRERGNVLRSGLNSADFAECLATILRRVSIFAAVANTVCIILACTFQFSDFFSTCYCNSSVLGRGERYAFNIIAPGYDYDQMRAAWIGGLVLASGYVSIFLFALHLTIEPSINTIRN